MNFSSSCDAAASSFVYLPCRLHQLLPLLCPQPYAPHGTEREQGWAIKIWLFFQVWTTWNDLFTCKNMLFEASTRPLGLAVTY